jgi:hypothetical protein
MELQSNQPLSAKTKKPCSGHTSEELYFRNKTDAQRLNASLEFTCVNSIDVTTLDLARIIVL